MKANLALSSGAYIWFLSEMLEPEELVCEFVREAGNGLGADGFAALVERVTAAFGDRLGRLADGPRRQHVPFGGCDRHVPLREAAQPWRPRGLRGDGRLHVLPGELVQRRAAPGNRRYVAQGRPVGGAVVERG